MPNPRKWTVHMPSRLLLDSRVVDVPMASNSIVVTLSSLKPFFFNSLNTEVRFSDHVGAASRTMLEHTTLESNKSVT